ncbi:DEAD/DEAH box helicase [Halomonas marinisediminis]|uniref:ATP-dependent RNA helicase RhlE n=1 Tax=Halomonas marinisediminis TaxID=2546095 RepID=A0ABY2DBH4_9GAMM|nr:DEAD/DEAH box helicase [Halomonas marinisediminis]TDB05641.1 DEAD/DEAH box helicase [Halomonas marinisediminis]
MTFSELGLRAELLSAVEAQGYTIPTPIQQQAIPAVLKGGDLLASAQTGTGKTAGFTLPMLQRLADGPRPGKRQVRALVLTPTRELAAQVGESVANYGRLLTLKSHVIFGGVGQQPQVDAIRPGLDVLVATPGRLLDLQQQKHVDLSKVEILVLDEADRMLDMGFIHDIKKILRVLPEKRQNLLFSATFSNEIQALANKLLDDPKMIEVARRNTTAELVDQAIYRVDREKKRELLAHLITEHDWHQVLVFTRTKHGANRLAEQLSKQEIPAMAIHGNKSQSARTKALAAFKTGDLQVLVATDIAARGLDIEELPHVVNFELPNVAEDYVHRIGRTGRAGSEGQAVSLVCVDEHGLLKGIERLIKRDLEKRIEPGFEPDPNAKPEPIENGRNRRGGGGRGGNPQKRGGGGQPRGQGQRRDDDQTTATRRRRRGGRNSSGGGRQQA